jgi:hypothetical protein
MQELLLEIIRRDLLNQGITNYNIELFYLDVNIASVTPTVTYEIKLAAGKYYLLMQDPCMISTFVNNVLRFELLSDNGSAFFERYTTTVRDIHLMKTVGSIAHNENISVIITPNTASGTSVVTLPFIKVTY